MTDPSSHEVIYRHTRIVRIAHWINALCFLLLLMSGLQIFNAHPALYWGQSGANYDTPWLSIPGGIPGLLTLPSHQDLATGRNWHFFFAWALVILAFFTSTAAWCWFVCRRNGGVRSCNCTNICP